MRFHELWIEFQRLANIFKCFAVESIGADECESVIGMRVFRIFLESFFEKIRGVGIVKALVHQAAPADAIESIRGRLRHRTPELVIGLLIFFRAPVALRAEIWVGGSNEGFVALLRFGSMAMLAKSVAVVRRCGPGEACSHEAQQTHREAARPLLHLSSSCCTRARSTSALDSCVL